MAAAAFRRTRGAAAQHLPRQRLIMMTMMMRMIMALWVSTRDDDADAVVRFGCNGGSAFMGSSCIIANIHSSIASTSTDGCRHRNASRFGLGPT